MSRQRTTKPDRISRKEIRAALKRSGYLLESRAGQVLEQLGWTVSANYAFSDPRTQTSRELDIVATHDRQLEGRLGVVRAVIAAECVNNPQPFVVFPRSTKVSSIGVFAIRVGGLLRYMLAPPDGGHWEWMLKAAGATKWHHYCSELQAASQFCSFQSKPNSDWMATHETAHFGCIRALEDAVTHLRSYEVQSVRQGGARGSVRLELYYPMLILQGQLVEAKLSGKRVILRRSTNSLLRRGIIEDGVNDVFFTDVVTEGAVAAMSKRIRDEVGHLSEFLEQHASLATRSLVETGAKLDEYLATRRAAEATGQPVPEWPPFAM